MLGGLVGGCVDAGPSDAVAARHPFTAADVAVLMPMPTDVTAARWPAVLDEMASEAGLTAPDRRALERYLLTLATP